MLSFIAAWLAASGIHPQHLVAGLFGGIVRAVVGKQGSIWERLATGFVGALAAGYLTPLVALLIVGASPAMLNGVAFCLGLMGMSLCEALIAVGKDYARNPGKLKQDVRSFLLRVLKGKDDG